VGEVAHLVFRGGVVGAFGTIDGKAHGVLVDGKTHIVKDKELGFGTKVSRIADAGLAHVSQRAFRS